MNNANTITSLPRQRMHTANSAMVAFYLRSVPHVIAFFTTKMQSGEHTTHPVWMEDDELVYAHPTNRFGTIRAPEVAQYTMVQVTHRAYWGAPHLGESTRVYRSTGEYGENVWRDAYGNPVYPWKAPERLK